MFELIVVYILCWPLWIIEKITGRSCLESVPVCAGIMTCVYVFLTVLLLQ